jgi:hypothetical protein
MRLFSKVPVEHYANPVAELTSFAISSTIHNLMKTIMFLVALWIGRYDGRKATNTLNCRSYE